MASSHSRSASTSSQAQPAQTSSSRRESSPFGSPSTRSFSTARLASPVPGTPPTVRQIATQRSNDNSESATPLPGRSASRPHNIAGSGPGPSSLSAAIKQSLGQSPPRFGNLPGPSESPSGPSSFRAGAGPRSNYGSFAGSHRDSSVGRSPGRTEDIEVLRRHLVGPGTRSSGSNLRAQAEGSPARPALEEEDEEDDDAFDSLQLQGGDMTRHIYRYTDAKERQLAEEDERRDGRLRRSLSMNLPRDDEDPEVANIKKPGGLRREFIRRTAASPSPDSGREPRPSNSRSVTEPPRNKPQFVANNFIEFLTLYGHFAGETLDEDDENLGPDEYFSSEYDDTTTDGEERDEDEEYGEDSALLTPSKRRRRRKVKKAGGASPGGAALLLLKSFVGTGVLFLPRAFLNGGMLFSNVVLLLIAALSFWCFILLVNVRLRIHASFGDMGGQIYGKHFRNLINFSLVVSQIGFAAAYIVFVGENLQAFISAVTKCRTFVDIKWLILLQIVIFMPLSLYRNINNIQKPALVADAFIVLGLVYLYYYDIFTLATNHGIADIELFNSNDWTLFIGTAIFTFEGIGLIIPIQSGMKNPEKFPKVLGVVMAVVTVVMVSIGALSYAAYGSATKTVILLNMPQDSKMVNGVQFIYSVAILLSTPLQIYPAIEITSQQLFSRTGKYNPRIKWEKNVFRFFMVILCGAIAYAGSNDLDKFVAIVGSFACVPLVYIYPPLMHYRTAADGKTWKKIADVCLVLFGFAVMGYTTALTVISWAGGSDVKAPGYCDDK
ncbi:hypothetical protein AAFC00_003628 [Neodothiora populina]|uniref:Amino acid transporter transmembrane domain-containing protein n=1 Tax=Neodothiora populina TaxID=2781224 RepID=A0ABR3PF79_9PEZI